MATMTYYVALAFKKSEDDEEARSSEQAIRLTVSLATQEGHCGAIAFSRTGDPALDDFDDAVILKSSYLEDSRRGRYWAIIDLTENGKGSIK